MSADFFGLLARKAVAPRAIWPRLASRFEDGNAGLNAAEDRIESPPPVAAESAAVPSVPSRQVHPRAPLPAMPVDASATVPARPLPPRVAEAAGAPRPAQTPERDASQDRARFSEIEPLRVQPLQQPIAHKVPHPTTTPAPAPSAAQAAVGERITHERVEHTQTALRSLIESRVVERLTIEPGRIASASSPASPTSQPVRPMPVSTAAPRVEIHIGRIELLPAAAPGVEPRAAEAASQRPPQSLDAYLAQRRRS